MKNTPTYGPSLVTQGATQAFLHASGLGSPSVRALHTVLRKTSGVHSTASLAAKFGVQKPTILRRLRILAKWDLARQVKGEGRMVPGGTGGRNPDMWGRGMGGSIDGLVKAEVRRLVSPPTTTDNRS